MKYVDTKVVMTEIPDEITLAINISGCPCHCKGCHSSYLAEDIGEVLTFSRIIQLIKANNGITAICFMGGDSDAKLINHYAELIKESTIDEVIDICKTTEYIELPKGTIPSGSTIKITQQVPNPIKVGWYSGRDKISDDINLENFDYIKIGRYDEFLGPLNSKTTNQRLYKVKDKQLFNITERFWK